MSEIMGKSYGVTEERVIRKISKIMQLDGYGRPDPQVFVDRFI